MKKVLFLSFVLTSTHTFAEPIPNPVVEAIQRDIIARMKKNGLLKKSAKNKHIALSYSGSNLNHTHNNHYGNNSAWYSLKSGDIKHMQDKIQDSQNHSISSIVPPPPKLQIFEDVDDAKSFVYNDNKAFEELKEKHKKELAECQKQIQQLEQQIAQSDAKLNVLSEKHEKQLQEKEQEIQEYEEKLTDYEECQSKQNTAIEHLTSEIKEQIQCINDLKTRNQKQYSAIENLHEVQKKLKKDLDEAQHETKEFVNQCIDTIAGFQENNPNVPLLINPVTIKNTEHIKQWISAACEELTKQHDYLSKFTLALQKVASEDRVKEAMVRLEATYASDQDALKKRYGEFFTTTQKELKETQTQLNEAEQANQRLQNLNDELNNQIAVLETQKKLYLEEYKNSIKTLQETINNLTTELEKKAHLENEEWEKKLLSLAEQNSQLIKNCQEKEQECVRVQNELEKYKNQYTETIQKLQTEHTEEIEVYQKKINELTKQQNTKQNKNQRKYSLQSMP